jgi:hypothetical protein
VRQDFAANIANFFYHGEFPYECVLDSLGERTYLLLF